MKTVILCGGRGLRLGEHGASLPKALIEIGGRPVLWHLLKLYAHHGLSDFILCLGYLGDEIKRYFLEHQWLYSDFTLELKPESDYALHKHQTASEDWRITFAETGLDTNTGGRLKRIERYLGGDEEFCVTYGDGLADINLRELIEFHRRHQRPATLTAVNPRSQFGLLRMDESGAVTEFQEKPMIEQWINGGFFVFNRRVFDYLDDNSVLEREPLERLARERRLMAYRHSGFWKCLDTYKDHLEFNQMWDAGAAAWKVW
ncbi:MAG TPA: glucose-1-phosphate cytidylyltransferase [Blastocatellia bacterium]|nr:glucose-1-phosphate cytidylyltransferase [Blastocatellia bacterium]